MQGSIFYRSIIYPPDVEGNIDKNHGFTRANHVDNITALYLNYVIVAPIEMASLNGSDKAMAKTTPITKRKAIVVLGNHRSGTSALTRVISLLGAELPENLMAETPDNPEGYWESRSMAKINQAALFAAGTAWHDDAPISDEWFSSEPASTHYHAALDFLQKNFGNSKCFVLKDPRLCRLLPLWKRALDAFDAEVHFVLIVRHPQEVFSSFKARKEMGYPSVTSHAKSDLLWMRHVLEAEHQTRSDNRTVLTYDALLTDWRKSLAHMLQTVGEPLEVTDANILNVNDFLSASHSHHHASFEAQKGDQKLAIEVYSIFAEHSKREIPLPIKRLDEVRESLNLVEGDYKLLRAGDRLDISTQSPWHSEVLSCVRNRATQSIDPPLQVLYISQHPNSKTHIYRVVHHVAALRSLGIEASWTGLDDCTPSKIESADVVVALRAMWSDKLAECKVLCKAKNIPFVYDIDDLIFDPDVMKIENFGYFPKWNAQNDVELHLRTLVEADVAVTTTEPLATAAQKFGVPAYVLPNGLNDEMIAQSNAALDEFKCKPSQTDGMLRIGYASGNPTHQNDFATIVPVLCALLDEHIEVLLTLVGHLDQSEFPELAQYQDRIETRSLVPHSRLLREYTRFDISLAPLECGNPFCEAKSALKYLEAGLVQVPTVAAATQPFSVAIKQGETGFTAENSDEWHTHLTKLITDKEERTRLGQNARTHVLAAYGPTAKSAAAQRVFQEIVANHVSQ
jgi:glycosyltransferase involved in cell wall biosynthesis